MEQDKKYYAHAKLLLTGEYWVLHGARALGIPLSVGQGMNVNYKRSYDPRLIWKARDHRGDIWFEESFDLWRFRAQNPRPNKISETLSELLLAAREANKHFLRDDVEVNVETNLSFPIEWGLGSSASLVVLISQWARVSPFALQEKIFGGSGADVAISQAMGPIVFERQGKSTSWRPVEFYPPFHQQLYFIYLGKKQCTREAISMFHPPEIEIPFEVMKISGITEEILRCQELGRFQELMRQHDEIVSQSLGKKSINEECFPEFKGIVKSLGAWGGDFALVASDQPAEEIRQYFEQKGVSTLIPFCEMYFNGREGFQGGK